MKKEVIPKERKPLRQKDHIEYIPLNKCVPMPEIHRQGYNPRDYQYLKNLIEMRGFNPCFAVRGIWNKEGLFEVFDGTHRLQATKELGNYCTIPARDESSFRTRSEAILEGIISNQARSAFNPVDLAESLQEYGKTIAESFHSSTKPKSIGVYEIAERMQMSPAKISLLLKLLKLPKEVQDFMREGKLKFTHARPLMTLIETEYEKNIISIASDAVKKGSSVRDLWAKVGAVKLGGTYNDTVVCGVCHKPHPRLTMKHEVCPNCIVKRNNIEQRPNESTIFTKYSDFVVKRYGERGIGIPLCIVKKMQELRKVYPEGNMQDEKKWEREAFYTAHPEKKLSE